MNKVFFLLFIILQVLLTPLSASSIDVSQNSQEILLHSGYYIDKNELSFTKIKQTATFKSTKKNHINLGFVKQKTLWIKLNFINPQEQTISKVLEIKNPLLERVTLYSTNTMQTGGVESNSSVRRTINTMFEIQLQAHEEKVFYLEVKNSTTALRVALNLLDKESFLNNEQVLQAKIFLFFGILFMLALYSVTLYIYTKETSYAFYAVYLLALIAQQSTYLGVSQMFLPSWLMHYDNLAVVLKVNGLYIAAAIFAKSFLQTKRYPLLDKIYNIIIVVALIEIPLVGFPVFYFPEVAILTGFVFILFNMSVGVYATYRGYKQARFFVLGWSFLVIGFSLMILDGLGVITVMQNLPNLIMYLTALEAILLSLAFTDRYIILKNEKIQSDKLLLDALTQRQSIIENEIEKQTKHLNAALENEQVILKELQHRTKNNLQLILSLTRMQSDNATLEVKSYLKNLENRINAIAKTHEMLYLKDDLHDINMDEYIEELCCDLESLSKKEIVFQVEVKQVYMPFREASYVGLILNELITNSIKYVNQENIVFSIQMHKIDREYRITLKDNGQCYDYKEIKKQSMGLKLVNTLVNDQLAGNIVVRKNSGCMHIIEFEL